MKVLKDFYRIYFKKYGNSGDSLIEENKKRIDSIVDFNKDYSNKTRIICGIIEFSLIHIIVTIILELYNFNYYNIRDWTLQRGIVGLFLFVFSIGIPSILFAEAFIVFYDDCINFLSIKVDKEKIKKFLIPIAIIAFIVYFVFFMISWMTLYNVISKI